MYDVVTIGETMLRLTPDALARWEQAERLQVHVGGSESNTAVGLSRLGMRVCWLTRLTQNDFGRRIAQTIQAQSVDTQHIAWTEEDRVGVYFFEEASPPRSNRVIYDRANSAFTRYSAAQLPTALFQANVSRCLHVTGISLALGDIPRAMIQRAVELARQAGWLISFDLNYRAKLWSPSDARKHCEELFQTADIVFIPQRDAHSVWKLAANEDPQSTLNALTKIRRGMLSVMTMGQRGAAVQFQNQTWIDSISPVAAVGRLGGGDAFAAGFLYGWLTYQDPSIALKWANACAVVKYSIPGDLPLFQRSEVEQYLSQSMDQASFR